MGCLTLCANASCSHHQGASTDIEGEGRTLIEVFEALSALEEIFGHGHEVCGICGCKDTAYQTRTDKQANKWSTP